MNIYHDKFFSSVLTQVLTKFEREINDAREDVYATNLHSFSNQGYERGKRLAPQVSAAVKRAKVRLIEAYLQNSKLDLTITSSEKVFLAVLGRSVSQKNKGEYGTAGRTARDKTNITNEQIETLANEIKPKLQVLLHEMDIIKDKVKMEHLERVKIARDANKKN
jgi:hypothetical protein